MRRVFLACLAVSLLWTASAFAQTRHAFVVGIDTYDYVGSLAKARNDARAVAGALEEAGFRTQLVIDADETALLTELTRFSSQLDPGDEVVFYFAGHGVEINGRNYLLPADVPSVAPGQELVVTRGALPVSSVIDQFNARGVRLSLLILDACRDNPFETLGTRSLGRSVGLGREEAPEGTFVMFSAGAGQQALDRLSTDDPNPNSVFTRVLLPRLTESGLSLRTMVREVRSEVRALGRTVAHEQFPAVYDQLDGAFTFVPVAAAPDPIDDGLVTPPTTAPIASNPCAAARADWSLIGETPSVTLLQAYSAAHSGCPLMMALASECLASLTGNPVAPIVLPTPVRIPVPPSLVLQEDGVRAEQLFQVCVDAAHPDNITSDDLAIAEALNRADEACDAAALVAEDLLSATNALLTALLGRIEHVHGNYDAAFTRYQTASRAGDAVGTNNLGYLYETGLGVRADPNLAVQFYRTAGQRGLAAGWNNYGLAYYNGDIVPQDFEQALLGFEEAASAGYPQAFRRRGVMYRDGLAVPTSDTEAMRWFRSAMDAGDAFAHIYVGWQHQYGNGVPIDNREAANWFMSGLAAGSDHPIRNPGEFNGAVGQELQTQLRDRGYYNGAIDGAVGPGTVAAMQAFFDTNNQG